MQLEKIQLDTPFVTLGQLLKIASLIQTGGESKLFLAENKVLVNGVGEVRRGRKLYKGDIISVGQKSFQLE